MLNIPFVSADSLSEAAGALKKTPPQTISNVNWPGEFPYAPRTTFYAGHNGKKLFLLFEVNEEVTMAAVSEDNGEVWTDSAVEFFITFDEKGYYNFEFNCIGTALLGFRKVKPEATHAGKEIMRLIERQASLSHGTFAEKKIDGGWTLAVAIPVEAFFAHRITDLGGIQARANFYKCGDNLSKPHFVSWNPIGTPSPNFHVPEYFGEVNFEGFSQ